MISAKPQNCPMSRIRMIVLLLALFLSSLAVADQVEIVAVQLIKQNQSWLVKTTLRHADSGEQHYADGWRVVNDMGKELGYRILYHPHVDEQPFTRSLPNIFIPKGTHIVYVEAHDKKHGWSKQRVRVDLRQKSGPHFTVKP